MLELKPVSEFSARVLDWYDLHGRKQLPWQENKTPYRVWISEIMLQQTQVATVIPYYLKFMESFPNVESLARASEDDVLAHWSGLGYYSRARNLHKAAKILQDDWAGEFPTSQEGMCELPGIGRSTSAAILSIAREAPLPILDGNVKRVLSRLHALPVWPGEKQAENALWTLAEQYMPQQRCGAYTQAMMDLGATLCTRSRPQCLLCPVKNDCLARQQGDPTNYPIRKPKKDKPTKHTFMLIAQQEDGKVLLEKRPPSGIWGGLWSLPETQERDSIELDMAQRFGCQSRRVIEETPFRHTFSHYHLQISPVRCDCQMDATFVMENNKYQWFSLEDCLSLGLPAPVRSLLESLSSVSVL